MVRRILLVWVLAVCTTPAFATISQTWVWQCTSASRSQAAAFPSTTVQGGTCPNGSGSWVQITWSSDGVNDYATPADYWWGQQLAGTQLTDLLTAVILLCAVVWVCREVMRSLKK